MIIYKLACVFAAAVGMLVISTGAFAQGAPLFSVLNGGNECDSATPPNCRQGDLNGFGSATIIFPTLTSVCFGIVVHGVEKPIAAHIHRGTSGLNGPIVVILAPPVAPSAGNPGASSGCFEGVPVATVNAIRLAPTNFYVNVHSSAFPAGAVRGQLQ